MGHRDVESLADPSAGSACGEFMLVRIACHLAVLDLNAETGAM